MNALRQVTVLSEEVARATLHCASGYLQLKNTDALRRSERSLSPAGEEWGSPCGGLEERTCRPRPGCQRRAERPPCRRTDVASLGPSLVSPALRPGEGCRRDRRREGRVPRKGNPTPLPPHNGESEAVLTSPTVTVPGYRPRCGVQSSAARNP